MLTREQHREIEQGWVVDVKIIGPDHPQARDCPSNELLGKVIRLHVIRTDVKLMSPDELRMYRDPSSSRAPDPILRGIYGQALIGEHMPPHILRVHNEEDETKGALLGFWDWSIEDIHVVARARA